MIINKLFFLGKLPWYISRCPQSFPPELKAAIVLISPTCIEGDDDHNLQLASTFYRYVRQLERIVCSHFTNLF